MSLKICKKCKKTFPEWMVIDGKKRNLQKRKYCLDCSPFNSHNTATLENYCLGKKVKICIDCEREHSFRLSRCTTCERKYRKKIRSDKIYGLTGNSCWFCNYDKGEKARPVLEFHHLFDKKMSLTTRELAVNSMKRIVEEIQKCTLLCCRCHREVHVGIIDEKDIKILHEKKWKELRKTKKFEELI